MWIASFKGSKLEQTKAVTEAGSWNLLYSIWPSLANQSRKNAEKLGYAVKKVKEKQNDTPIV